MPGMFFVERWIDKFVLLSTWLDGIGAGNMNLASYIFYSHFLVYAICLMVWNEFMWDDNDEIIKLDWT